MKKIVYIAHPVASDITGNLQAIKEIYRQLSHYTNVIPFAPYWITCHALSESNRNIGFEHNKAFFDRKVMDEVWLYGDRISSGMQQEIEWAEQMGIPVVSMSEGTRI